MPDETAALPTLLDIAKSDAGIGYPIIMEASRIAPELRLIPADTMVGTEMKLTVNVGLPTVGFRRVNEGAPRSRGSQDARVFQCFDLDHQIACDDASVQRAKDKGRFLENEAVLTLEAAFQKVSRVTYYGTGEDEKAFPGLIEQYLPDALHETDATGANNKTSVWFVRLGRETLEYLFGNGRTIRFNEEWKEETIYDKNGNPIPGWTNWMRGCLGMRLANKHCAMRLKNLGSENGKGLTDDLMFDLNQKFTEFGPEPTHILMNGRSQEQLRKSRATDLNPNPDLPKEWNGIPIIRTAGLVNNEA